MCVGQLLLLAGLYGCTTRPNLRTRESEPVAVASARPVAQTTLYAGTSGDYPPFSVADGDRFAGFSIDLVEAYARDRNLAVSWRRFLWPEFVSDLLAGRFELASSGITVRPERSIAGRYTVPIAVTGSVLLVRRPAWLDDMRRTTDDWLRVLDDGRLRLGVNRGGHLERIARERLPHAQIVTFDDNRLVPAALARAELDAALTNTIEEARWRRLSGANIESVGPFTREYVALYAPKDAGTLTADLDDWLIHAETSGELARLREAAFASEGTERTALVVPALLAAIAERLALMPFVAEAKQRSGKPIDDPEQEARVLTLACDQVGHAAMKLGLPAPPDARVRLFFQAQMDAAKTIQRLPREPSATSYALDTELRPAVARVSDRIHRLVAQVPRGLSLSALTEQSRVVLQGTGLSGAECDAIAQALYGLSHEANPDP